LGQPIRLRRDKATWSHWKLVATLVECQKIHWKFSYWNVWANDRGQDRVAVSA